MAQFMVLNPGRRRRRKRARARRRPRARVSAIVNRPRRRRRRNPGMYLLNRGRRRRVTRRRRHANPFKLRMPSRGTFFGIDFGAGVLVAGGSLANGIAANQIANLIPIAFVKSPAGRLILKLVLAPVLGQLGGMALGKEGGKLLVLGATAGVALDAYKMAQAAIPQLPGVGDYNEVLSDYVTASTRLSGYAATPGLATITQPNPRPVFLPNWHGTG